MDYRPMRWGALLRFRNRGARHSSAARLPAGGEGDSRPASRIRSPGNGPARSHSLGLATFGLGIRTHVSTEVTDAFTTGLQRHRRRCRHCLEIADRGTCGTETPACLAGRDLWASALPLSYPGMGPGVGFEPTTSSLPAKYPLPSPPGSGGTFSDAAVCLFDAFNSSRRFFKMAVRGTCGTRGPPEGGFARMGNEVPVPFTIGRQANLSRCPARRCARRELMIGR